MARPRIIQRTLECDGGWLVFAKSFTRRCNNHGGAYVSDKRNCAASAFSVISLIGIHRLALRGLCRHDRKANFEPRIDDV